MSTKHVFSSGEGLVVKSLRGAVRLNPALKLHEESKTIYVGDEIPGTHVVVIAGGGAGHEPAHAGYTGRGMLAASVSGDIFASPSAVQVLTAIEHAAFVGMKGSAEVAKLLDGTNKGKPKDVLVLINNYTGDRLNFGLAIERARALYGHWIRIESVVNADDVSLLPKLSQDRSQEDNIADTGGPVGPRGLAANVLVCKILGALAERGADLDRIKAYGDAVVANLASVGVGLEHCHVPGRDIEKGKSGGAQGLGSDECEIGLGLHNEPGAIRRKLESPERLVNEMITMILRSRGQVGTGQEFVKGRDSAQNADEAILFVNNLGGMSQLEMNAILDEVAIQLYAQGINLIRMYQSAYMTSLNAPGFSISLLNTTAVKSRLGFSYGIAVCDLLDDATDAVAWSGTRMAYTTQDYSQTRRSVSAGESATLQSIRLAANDYMNTRQRIHPEQGSSPALFLSSKIAVRAIQLACRKVQEASGLLTSFDEVVGDGDCGETFARGATAILSALDSGKLFIEESNPGKLVKEISEVLEYTMGGTIGALFAIFLTALSTSLRASASWSTSLNDARHVLSLYTPAKPGDRTIMDALYPFCTALADGKDILTAATAAQQGAENTKTMKPRLGRATYVIEHQAELPPDPGAWGVAIILNGLVQGIISTM
ncbi:hypothetical protein AMATHDRAFT_65896 [Amanita thiersii Skay4041]|uniref:Dihydroxyacetone kinase n=1 Tax=Amanita thiersii Skay4041 TaxID=703135 RepID=A0A2A9NG11_9AGAR|nr:hypothetical protein AMATHDRAFT_65896 [Amanita thiersii Skay4041]